LKNWNEVHRAIDGHRLDHLIENLQNVKKMKGSILLHVITQKGKGYVPAEMNPARFHGVGPFVVETGEPKESQKKSPPSYTEAFGEILCQLARENKNLVAITAAMQSGTGLEKFSRSSLIVSMIWDCRTTCRDLCRGSGLGGNATCGAIYSTFLQRAYDQIQQDVCLQNLPVIFALDRGGIVGEDGPTHHGLFDFAYLRHLPNLVVMSPKNEAELQAMMKTAIECSAPWPFDTREEEEWALS